MNKKIVFICGATYSVIKFRYDLVKEFQKHEYEVSIIAMDDKYINEIQSWKVNFYNVNSNSRSINPINKLVLLFKFKKILELINPDIIFAFQTTPIIFGLLAAKMVKKEKVYAKLEGAGDVFVYNTIKWKIIRLITCILYKHAFLNVTKLIFENEDDKKEFINRKLIASNKCIVVKSVGVNLDEYEYRKMSNYETFLMIARMKLSKGVLEYCKAAEIVKEKKPNAVFNYIGDELTLKISDIKYYIDKGIINYLGYQDNILPYLESCYVHVLPSYREGFGLVTIQAGSVGRPSIVTDVVGSRDAVIDNVTGIIVPAKNADKLADAMLYALNNKEKMIAFGKASRKFVEESFDKNIINKRIYEIITNEQK